MPEFAAQLALIFTAATVAALISLNLESSGATTRGKVTRALVFGTVAAVAVLWRVMT
jgi:hypothetical protein